MGEIKLCPKCGNKLFLDREPDGWYEWCINCSYRSALSAVVGYAQMLAVSGKKRTGGSETKEPASP